MTEFQDAFSESTRKTRISKFNIAAMVGIPLVAILFQFYVTLHVKYLSYLELPLLVTVYFSLMKRSPVAGVFFGAGIGLAQDSLADHPVGMFGIVKTLVGYFAASVSQRFDVQNAMVRLALSFFFYFFHQFFYWVLARALLAQAVDFELQKILINGVLNAVVAVPLFHILDRLRITE
jgi:rod shape-determining protein MreD